MRSVPPFLQDGDQKVPLHLEAARMVSIRETDIARKSATYIVNPEHNCLKHYGRQKALFFMLTMPLSTTRAPDTYKRIQAEEVLDPEEEASMKKILQWNYVS